MSLWADVEPSNRERRSRVSRFSSLKLFEIANHESRKQWEEPESIRVQKVFEFSVCRSINRADLERKEAALR